MAPNWRSTVRPVRGDARRGPNVTVRVIMAVAGSWEMHYRVRKEQSSDFQSRPDAVGAARGASRGVLPEGVRGERAVQDREPRWCGRGSAVRPGREVLGGG